MFCIATMIKLTLSFLLLRDSVAEMAGGWGNYIMQDQPSFTVLDSFMMLICVYLLSCFPPGVYFPHMKKNRAEEDTRVNDEEEARAHTGEETQDDAEHSGSKSEKSEK